MKILVMEIWGDFGLFRKFYTTSSPLSFSIPPPTAVAGMMGAIVGLSREEYLETFNASTMDVAVAIVNPVKKTSITINHIETKGAILMSRIKQRTQTRTEFLRNAHFRLYLYIKDDSMRELIKQRLEKHETHYTLSLGLSELIANFEFLGEYKADRIEVQDYTEVVTAILADNIKENGVDFTKSGRYQKERIPVSMKPDRSVDEYRTIFLNAEGGNISVKAKNLWEVGDGNIVMFLGPLFSP